LHSPVHQLCSLLKTLEVDVIIEYYVNGACIGQSSDIDMLAVDVFDELVEN
jgi:hypothetical protein